MLREPSPYDEHPLAAELTSLRGALNRYQHDTHLASSRLQRQSLDTAVNAERLRALERENAILRSEVTVLRAHPDAAPHPASLQISELTLALRHVSDKLTTTEETLLLRTRELAHAQGDTRTTRHALDGAIRQIDMAQQRERKSNARMRELQQRIRAAEEERKLMDIVVQEYADLVRELDARRSPSSSFTASSLTLASSDSGSGLASDAKLSTTLSEGKLGLRRLLADFGTETARLEDEIARLNAELAAVLAKSEASTKAHEENMDELAELRARLDKVQVDDRSAAQMVSRYMRFSQQSTNTLQKSMEALRARHDAALVTLTSQLAAQQQLVTQERTQAHALRQQLDMLTEDISRESYGRRREVALRLAVVGREERTAEGLRRWRRRAEERLARTYADDEDNANAVEQLRMTLEGMICDAEDLLAELDLHEADAIAAPQDGGTSGSKMDGSLGRVLLAEEYARSVMRELEREVDRRLMLEMKLFSDGKAEALPPMSPPPPPLKRTQRKKIRRVRAKITEPLQARTDDTVVVAPVVVTQPQEVEVPTTTSNSIAIPEPISSTFAPHSVLHTVSEETPMQSTFASPVSPTRNGINRPVEALELKFKSSSPDVDIQAPQTPTIPDEHSTISTISTLTITKENKLPACETVVHTATDMSPSESNFSPHISPISNLELATISDPDLASPVVDVDRDAGSAPEATSPNLYHPKPITPIHAEPVLMLEDEEISHVSDDFGRPPSPHIDNISNDEQDDASLASITIDNVDENADLEDGEDEAELSEVKDVTNGLNSSNLIEHEDDAELVSMEHPLLAELEAVKHRYDDLARAFRDCHHALRDLKSETHSLSEDSTGANAGTVLRTAIERLDDVNEDVRVELEIRVADEERLVHGYETLLSMPHALENLGPGEGERVEEDIVRFITGDDEKIRHAMQTFVSKREDIEHDVAEVKRVLHRMLTNSLLHPDDAIRPSSEDTALPPMPNIPTPLTPPLGPTRSWASWTGGLLSGSRPSSPAPPTFGNGFAAAGSTGPGLRHSASLASLSNGRTRRMSSSFERPEPSPFVNLGLQMRVQMPAHVTLPHPPPATMSSPQSFRAHTSSLAPPQTPPRPMSSVLGYPSMLGVSGSSPNQRGPLHLAAANARTLASPGLLSRPLSRQQPLRPAAVPILDLKSDEESDTGFMDSDVE